jgi:hypothetical protein
VNRATRRLFFYHALVVVAAFDFGVWQHSIPTGCFVCVIGLAAFDLVVIAREAQW